MTPLPEHQILLRIFVYDEEGDELRWTNDPLVPVRVRGKLALNSRSGSGYRFGRFQGKHLSRHRAIWKLVTGTEPDELDHIDGNPGNDRPSNLRSVSHQENCRNRKVYATNKSGVPGVSWNARDGKWMAHIHIGKRMKNLGMFANKSDAIAAREAAEVEQGYKVRRP